MSVLRIRITLMRIRIQIWILFFVLLWIRTRIRILTFNLMQIRIRTTHLLLQIWTLQCSKMTL